jgi:putative transposase
MPDHIHLILTPAPDVSLEKAIQYIKDNFSHRLKSKMDVWERSYTNHRIKDSTDLRQHINYIHQNPIRSRLAMEPKLYPFSSANPIHPMDATPIHLL